MLFQNVLPTLWIVLICFLVTQNAAEVRSLKNDVLRRGGEGIFSDGARGILVSEHAIWKVKESIMRGRTCSEACRKFENNGSWLFLILILYVLLKYQKQRSLYCVIIGSSLRIPIFQAQLQMIYDKNQELRQGRYAKSI